MKYPRSPYDKEGGLYFFPRMLDKIRLNHQGQLHEENIPNLGKRLDAFVCEFLGVDYMDVVKQVIEGASDPEVFEWCCANGIHRSEFDIFLCNKYLVKLGWNDDDTGVTQRLAEYKAEANLSHRDDILTMFDFIEAMRSVPLHPNRQAQLAGACHGLFFNFPAVFDPIEGNGRRSGF